MEQSREKKKDNIVDSDEEAGPGDESMTLRMLYSLVHALSQEDSMNYN